MVHGQIDPNPKEKNGYLKSSGAVVHSRSQIKSVNAFKATNNNANSLTGKPGKSDYGGAKKGYIKKNAKQTGPTKTIYSKHSKVYKLYAPKTSSQDPFGN